MAARTTWRVQPLPARNEDGSSLFASGHQILECCVVHFRTTRHARGGRQLPERSPRTQQKVDGPPVDLDVKQKLPFSALLPAFHLSCGSSHFLHSLMTPPAASTSIGSDFRPGSVIWMTAALIRVIGALKSRFPCCATALSVPFNLNVI